MTSQPIVVHLIAAARPNFMKIAPLYHALTRETWCSPQIVHTGQHYDANMSDAFFRDLRLPTPHFHLEVGSGTHAEQAGGVMIAYEKVAMVEKPHWIVVVGDVNSTAACAMVGTKLWIPVVHLEAGLRSGDRRMPEEINRLVTDAICDVLWTPSPDADEHLAREGVPESKIDRVGNIMLDSFEMLRSAIEADSTRESMRLEPGNYAVVTLHRPSNVDNREGLEPLVQQLVAVSQDLPLVFAVHPRTRKKLQDFGLLRDLEAGARDHADGAAGLHPVHEPRAQCPRRDHGLRRRAGREHLPRHPVPHAAREHRTTHHRLRRLESPGEAHRAVQPGGRGTRRALADRSQTCALGRKIGRTLRGCVEASRWVRISDLRTKAYA